MHGPSPRFTKCGRNAGEMLPAPDSKGVWWVYVCSAAPDTKIEDFSDTEVTEQLLGLHGIFRRRPLWRTVTAGSKA